MRCEDHMKALETKRLHLSPLSFEHCEFVLELLNEPSFIRFIGDKKVSTFEEARGYLAEGPLRCVEEHGYGMFLVSSKFDGDSLGMCGLVKRAQFGIAEIGFAFLRRHWAQGYALESARAVLDHAQGQLGLSPLIAIADSDNLASIRLLKKLGFRFEKMVRLNGEAVDIQLFTTAPL